MNVILGLILASIVFLMANGLYKLLNRPKICSIDQSERPNSALLVIDMQEDFTRSTGRFAHDPDARDVVITEINQLAASAHEAGIPVIEVSHVFVDPIDKLLMKLVAGGAGVEGSDGLERDRDLTYHANFHVTKHQGDSLTAPMLQRFCEDHKIGHLYLTGQEATACVHATGQGALKRNYKVTLLDRAILARKPEKWTALADGLRAKGAASAKALTI